jgi:hypothetical protein
MQAQLKKLRAETTNREGIAKRATDKARLVWLAQHYGILATRAFLTFRASGHMRWNCRVPLPAGSTVRLRLWVR